MVVLTYVFGFSDPWFVIFILISDLCLVLCCDIYRDTLISIMYPACMITVHDRKSRALHLGCLDFCPVIDEVGRRLRLDGGAWLIFDMVSPQLYRPLCNPSRGFPVLDDICKWCQADYSYGMLLEVVLEFSACHKHTKD